MPLLHLIRYHSGGETALRRCEDLTGLLVGPTDRPLAPAGIYVSSLRGASADDDAVDTTGDRAASRQGGRRRRTREDGDMRTESGTAPTSRRTAFLLGAGFSKAIHPRMPLMPELRDRVLDALSLGASELDAFSGDLEAWLSYLSTRQPWDSEAQALRNLARFREVSSAIADEVERAAPRRGEHAQAAESLTRLVLQWCLDEADVLTFNYDLLVEGVLAEWGVEVTGSDMYPLPLIERKPQSGGLTFGLGAPRIPLPLLYKLHGSVNWMYPGLDVGDGPVTFTELTAGSGAPTERRARHLLDDLSPLVVPPTATKSAFYGNSALRALWRNASEALGRADELVVIGYSFPVSDQQVATFIRRTLPVDATIHIVDIGSAAADRAEATFRHEVVRHEGDDAVDRFIDETAGSVVEWSTDVENEWLRTPEGTMMRPTPYAQDRRPAEVSDRALEELTRSWPSVGRTWQSMPWDDKIAKTRWRAYVPAGELSARPDPWADR